MSSSFTGSSFRAASHKLAGNPLQRSLRLDVRAGKSPVEQFGKLLLEVLRVDARATAERTCEILLSGAGASDAERDIVAGLLGRLGGSALPN